MKSDYQLRQEKAAITKILRERKRNRMGLRSSRSVTRWKDGHEYLVGVLAHTLRRIEIYKNAGGDAHLFDTDRPDLVEDLAPATCQGCVERHLIGWDSEEGQWHHN